MVLVCATTAIWQRFVSYLPAMDNSGAGAFRLYGSLAPVKLDHTVAPACDSAQRALVAGF
jgi:hypothetical protein